MSGKNKNFVTTQDWKKEELDKIIELALKMKIEPYNQYLKNRILFMLFFNPSLRTRSSFEAAMDQSGGSSVNLSVGKDTWKLEHRMGVVMDGAYSEHIIDASKVLSRYADAVSVRCFPKMRDWKEDKKDKVIQGFASQATVPVINMESSLYHPCQALADLLTIKENLADVKEKKIVISWCNHPKPLPMSVPNSAALISSKFGMDVSIACPEDYTLSGELVKDIESNCAKEGSDFEVTHDLNKGMREADIVYAKSWGSIKYYGDWEKEKMVRENLKDWKITKKNMRLTDHAKFMHCLPVRRNVVVEDEVIDDERSIVYDQAENRLHAQKALLAHILGDGT
ncbi:MAG: N-acetylornithine carbamoyltransferase [Thermoplasmatota archaeon]